MRASNIDPATISAEWHLLEGGADIWDPPVYACPYCQAPCHADFVDVEVGLQQCGPYYCHNCGASEIGTYDSPRELSAAEEKCGWYEPGQPVSDKANTIGGVPVSHKEALAEYKLGPASSLDPYESKPVPVRN